MELSRSGVVCVAEIVVNVVSRAIIFSENADALDKVEIQMARQCAKVELDNAAKRIIAAETHVQRVVRLLGGLQRLLVKAVLENTVDQLAIVSGTLQHVLTLPHNQLHGPIHAAQEVVHWNRSDKPLEELLLREHREKQKIVSIE